MKGRRKRYVCFKIHLSKTLLLEKLPVTTNKFESVSLQTIFHINTGESRRHNTKFLIKRDLRLRNANSRHVSVSVEGTSFIYGIPLEENEHLGQSVMSFSGKFRLGFNKS